MFRKVFTLAAIMFFFSICQVQAEQISVIWDGGGQTNLWSDADNWEPNIIPDNDGNTFAVTIDSGSR